MGPEGGIRVHELTLQLADLKQLYRLRKRACFDLIEVFSELCGMTDELIDQQEGESYADFQARLQVIQADFRQMVGLDEEDFEDQNV